MRGNRYDIYSENNRARESHFEKKKKVMLTKYDVDKSRSSASRAPMSSGRVLILLVRNLLYIKTCTDQFLLITMLASN